MDGDLTPAGILFFYVDQLSKTVPCPNIAFCNLDLVGIVESHFHVYSSPGLEVTKSTRLRGLFPLTC